MYAVDVDLVLRYLPPMDDHGAGIRLTRTIEMPFPPSNHIGVYSKSWEGIDDPMGYRLKEITWDLDRNRFLAETEISSSGIPIAMIPHEIRNLLKQGWEYGSHMDNYRNDRRRGRKRRKLPTIRIGGWDFEEAESWDTARGGARPKEYMLVMHAVISTMAELRNNCRVAYAMLKVGGYVDIPADEFPRDLSPLQTKFDDAMREYDAMTFDQGWKWADRVQRRYPRLIEVVEAMC